MFEQKGPETDVFFENLSSESNANISEEQLIESVNNAYKAAKRETIDDFLAQYWEYPFGQGGGGPIEPIVSINGKPWQETEWKDYIITHIRDSLYPTDPLVTNNEYWQVFLNPNNNGKAKEAIEVIEEQTLISKTTGQNAGIINQVILTLGKKEVFVYRDSKAEIHTLDVAPEAPDGITMVPLRGVLDFLGAVLNYDGDLGSLYKGQPITRSDPASGSDTVLFHDYWRVIVDNQPAGEDLVVAEPTQISAAYNYIAWSKVSDWVSVFKGSLNYAVRRISSITLSANGRFSSRVHIRSLTRACGANVVNWDPSQRKVWVITTPWPSGRIPDLP